MEPPQDLHDSQPDVVAAIRSDLVDWRQWMSRFVVLLFAALAGLAVVAFTWLSDRALHRFDWIRGANPLWPFIWTPLCTAGIVWLTIRYASGAAGSGIPQVMAALDPVVAENRQSLFVSLRLSVAKAFLTAGGLLGGLAIGREGPSVQIAAGVMHHARRWLPERSAISSHGLLVAGGAAGIAAAFNAPLAGVMFAIEELSRKIEQRNSGLLISAIVLAGLIGVSAFGNATYFGVIKVPKLEPGFVFPAALVVLGSGLLGGLFSRLLHASLIGQGDRVSRWRRRRPVLFAAICGLVIALIGWVSEGATFGSGYDYTRRLLEGQTELPLLYVTLRVIATWLATWSGVPGGIFAPSLAIGGGLGYDVAVLTGWDASSAALIALGMAGFLAAVTQAPITAFIIVMEMVDGHAMVLSLMTAALGASLISRWISRPLYSTLAQAQLMRLPPEADDSASKPANATGPVGQT
jgi:H+/Cl- antiporter ClcA